MLMPRDPKTLIDFHGDFSRGEPCAMMPGADYAHLMITLVDYYQYQREPQPNN